jgi:beta-fructofuranosidase
MFRLDDQWVWDSWIADDGDLYHLFFLKALRAVGSPSERHVNATVGHATTRDLVSWDYLGECFGPATPRHGAFDDLAIWTGSVIRDHDQW